MMNEPQPLLEVTRGRVAEAIHYGSIVVVDSHGKLIASYGDPDTVAFLRSSAKPFQAIPFVEQGGVEHYGYTEAELSISCASHIGSAMHAQTVAAMQQKIGIEESQLQCGAHLPDDTPMFKEFITSGRAPTANFNNCSGKHTTMLAYAKLRGYSLEDYLDIDHPLQQDILDSFSDLCLIPTPNISLGVDGCSAPNFAIPLFNAALGVARLCDPHALTEPRASACKKITAAMMAHPEMISGYGEFDQQLMKTGEGKILCKRGAEGFQIVGLMPGALGHNSAGMGIALKVMDGDASRLGGNLNWGSRARPAVMLEALRQLGALSTKQEQALAAFGPALEVKNHRGIVTGQSQPVFEF